MHMTTPVAFRSLTHHLQLEGLDRTVIDKNFKRPRMILRPFALPSGYLLLLVLMAEQNQN